MALSLLERVKNKALEALTGFSNFVDDRIDIPDIPDLPKLPQPSGQQPNILQGFGDIFKTLNSGIVTNDWKLKNPLDNPLVPLLGDKSPTTGKALDVLADFTYRPLSRAGAEGVMTLQGDQRNINPKDVGNDTIAHILYGDRPLQAFDNPNRPGREFARAIGHEELAPLFIGAGLAADAVPLNPTKIFTKGGIKGFTKAFGSFDEFAQALSKNKKALQEATAIFKDPKNPINTVEDLYAKYGPQVTKKTEDVINQARNATPKVEEITKTIDPFKPGNIFEKKSAPKKLFEDLFRSSKGVIGRSGQAGEEIVRRLNLSEQQQALWSGEATAKLEKVLKTLNSAEIESFADVVEGVVKPLSKAQSKAVKVWQEIADDVAKKATDTKLDFTPRQNYFPHQVSPLSKGEKQALAAEMVAKGQYKTEAEALQALDQQIAEGIGRFSERRFGNLEMARETDLPYNKSPNVLFDYIENAYGRIADAANFGKRDEELYRLARAAGTQGGDTDQIVKYLDQILGKNQTPNKVLRALTSLQTITKLNPVTSVVNLTQNLSTWLRTDTSSMAKAMGNIVQNPNKAYEIATKTGQISPSMAKELQDYIGTGNAASKWIRLIGMHGTERFNRVVAVNAGVEYAQKLAKQASGGSKAALRELNRLGIDPKDIGKNGELTEDALLKIGRQVSSETQFSTRAGELPYAWRTELGKVITQFKSFAYKQTGFVANNTKRTLSEASKGNVKPLINALVVYGIAAPIAGEIVNDFRALIRNKSREDTDTLTERYFSNILAASSFGLLDSTGGLLGEYGLGGVINTIGGPSVGDAQKLIQAAQDIPEGDPYNRTLRNAVKTIPAVGQTIANTLIPNSFVNNLNIGDVNLGVNHGLNKKDKQTYDSLRQTDPEAAEEFRRNNQAVDKTEDRGLLNMLFGEKENKKGSNDITWVTEDGYEKTVSIVDSSTSKKEGLEGYKAESDKAKKAVEIWGAPSDQVSDEIKADALKKLGFEENEVRYAYEADFTVDEKTAYIIDKNLPHDELIETLITGRVESIKGDYFASNGVIDNLYEEGLITSAERSYLKKLKINKDGKVSTSSLQGGGVSASKIKSMLNSINSLYKNPIATAQSIGRDGVNLKAPDVTIPQQEAPDLGILTRGGGKKRSQAQWFDPY